MQGKHTQREKRGRWVGWACFGPYAVGWLKVREEVGRSEGGHREIGGVAGGEARKFCAGRERCLVGDGRGAETRRGRSSHCYFALL